MRDIREEASAAFLSDDGAYITTGVDEEGRAVTMLVDGIGDLVAMAHFDKHEMALWAFRHDIQLSTVH